MKSLLFLDCWLGQRKANWPSLSYTWLLLSSVCPHISMCPPRWHRCWTLLTKSQNLSSKSSDILKTFFVLPCGHMTLQVLATLPPNDYRGYCSVSINAQKPSCICFCLQIYGRAHRAFIVSGCWRWLCCMSAWFPCCVCINSSWKNSDHVQQIRFVFLQCDPGSIHLYDRLPAAFLRLVIGIRAYFQH